MSGLSATPFWGSTLIFDLGSDSCKVGFAGDLDPTLVLPSVVGRAKHQEAFEKPNPLFSQSKHSQNESTSSSPLSPSSYSLPGRKGIYIGQTAREKAAVCALSYPIRNGVIADWGDMELLWEFMYQEIDSPPSHHPVLIAEPPNHSDASRARMAEILFETHQVPALNFSLQGLLAMYSTGRVTGLIVEVGDCQSHVVPVFDGFALQNSIVTSKFGGHNVTEYFVRFLTKNGARISTTAEWELARTMKEKYCYLSCDLASERERSTSLSVEFGKSGEYLSLGTERFLSGECLFDPSLLGVEERGLDSLILDSINSCDLDIRPHLFQNIILSGGSVLMNGFQDRVHHALNQLAPYASIRSFVSRDARYGVFAGASTFASFSTFPEFLISKKEYEESGSSVLQRKRL